MGRWLRIATTALALTIPGAVLPAAQAADPPVQITFLSEPKVMFAQGLTQEDGGKGAVVAVWLQLSRPARINARALDATGAVVRTFATDRDTGPYYRVYWQFTDAADADLPEGDYTLRVDATDADGGRDVESFPLPLDRHTIVPLQGVYPGTTYSTNVTMSIGPKPGVTLRSAQLMVANDAGTCATSGPQSPGFGGRIQSTVKVSDCGASFRDARAVFEFTDRIGAQQTGYTAPIPIRIADRVAPVPTLAPSSTATDTLSLREPDRYETTETTYDVREAGRIVSATYDIRNPIGVRVATGDLVAEGPSPRDDYSWQYVLRWDGTRHDGTRLPAGRYRVATRFTDAAGLSAAGPAVVLNLDTTVPGTLATTRVDGYRWQVVVTPKAGAGVTGVAVSTSPRAQADPELQPLTYDAASGTYRTVVSLAGRSPGTHPVRALITRGTGATATTFTTADQGLVVLPDTEAPVVTPPTITHLYLSAPDRYAGGSFEFTVSDQSSVRSSDFLVSDAAGRVVDHVVTDGAEGRTSFQWNGTGPQGERLPGGDYVVRTSFTDAAGNVTPASAAVTLDATVPGTMSVVATTKNTFTVELTPTPGVIVLDVFVWVDCCADRLEFDPSTGTYRTTMNFAGRPPGVYRLDGQVNRDTPGAADPQGWFWADPLYVTVTD